MGVNIKNARIPSENPGKEVSQKACSCQMRRNKNLRQHETHIRSDSTGAICTLSGRSTEKLCYEYIIPAPKKAQKGLKTLSKWNLIFSFALTDHWRNPSQTTVAIS